MIRKQKILLYYIQFSSFSTMCFYATWIGKEYLVLSATMRRIKNINSDNNTTTNNNIN